MNPRTKVAALALTTTCLLAACGSSGGSDAATDGDSASTTTTTEGSTTTTSTTEAETTSTTSSEATSTTSPDDNPEGVDTDTTQLDTLPDGDHYVYMAGLEQGKVEGQDVQVVIVDPVELLTGQAAIDAATDDGVTLDTDYYVRNDAQTVKRIAVVPDAQVFTLSGGGSNLVASSVSDVAMEDHLFKINVGNVRDITTISSIEAVYLA